MVEIGASNGNNPKLKVGFRGPLSFVTKGTASPSLLNTDGDCDA